MNRVYWSAAAILGLAGIISYILWLNEFPPTWDLDKGESISSVRVFLTTPFSIVIVGTLLTIPIALSKRDRLSEVGKTRNMAIMGVLYVPILTLSLQVLMPLMLYDIIEKNDAQLFTFLLTALFFLVMGNYVVTAKPGSKIGFRNRWTLSDPQIWTKTHRFLGRSLIIGTLLMVPSSLIIEPKYVVYALVVMAIFIKATTWLYARSLVQRLSLKNT